MKKAPIKSLIALGALCSATASVQAALYTDLDVFNGLTGVKVTKNGAPKTGTFEIVVQDNDGIFDIVGYDKDNEKVVGAIAEFTIWDDQLFDAPETVSIDLGATSFVSGQSAFFLIAVGQLSFDAIVDLSEDGLLNYSIKANSGDFMAINAKLIATTCPVPDGGSMLGLLGFGLVGLALVRNRLS